MDITTVTLQIVGMHCSSCAMNIDFELEDIEGVEEARTHYAKQVSVVKFDSNKATLEQIVSTIKKLGYQAVVVQGK